MQYLLLIYSDENRWQTMPKEQLEAGMAAYTAYGEALRKAGIMVANDRLKPSTTATTVSVANGKTHVQDGPFADSREQLGGFFLIDVPDLDAAISWASRCPGAQFGKIEVRPIWKM